MDNTMLRKSNLLRLICTRQLAVKHHSLLRARCRHLIPTFTLNDGTQIPSVGMGCWMGGVGGGERVFEMCKKAILNGYRHFDTASGYGNEKQVGDAIRASDVPRSEIYLTTKLPNSAHHRVRDSFEESLKTLDCDYIDLYLMHWPQGTQTANAPIGNAAAMLDGTTLPPGEHPTFIDTWKEMEKLLDTGKVKTIGVSNFSIKTLTELLPHCSIIPATNQVELHPCLPQEELKAFCDSKGIILTAYSPLGRSKTFFEEPAIKSIATKLNSTPAQVVLGWGVQRGTIVVPKSEDDQRMIANINLVNISDADMKEIDEIHRQPGMHRSLLPYHKEGSVLGWKYEWLGWNMTQGGIVTSN